MSASIYGHCILQLMNSLLSRARSPQRTPNNANLMINSFLFSSLQERLTSHSGIGLSSGTPAYNTHTGHSGRAVTTGSGHTGSGTGHSSGHGPSPSMHHQALQSDFQPPYFPPPFHHATQSPPQQQNHGPLEYLSADPYGQPLSSLHHAPLHHYNQLTGLRPTQDQLGIHRTHREAELQGHAVSESSDFVFIEFGKGDWLVGDTQNYHKSRCGASPTIWLRLISANDEMIVVSPVCLRFAHHA